MANIYKNIEGDTATEIVLDSNYVYNNMLLCNTHASDSVDVDLYITRTETTGTTYTKFDFCANGIKVTEDNTDINASGGTYLYIAFAEAPLVNSEGIPGNAR